MGGLWHWFNHITVFSTTVVARAAVSLLPHPMWNNGMLQHDEVSAAAHDRCAMSGWVGIVVVLVVVVVVVLVVVLVVVVVVVVVVAVVSWIPPYSNHYTMVIEYAIYIPIVAALFLQLQTFTVTSFLQRWKGARAAQFCPAHCGFMYQWLGSILYHEVIIPLVSSTQVLLHSHK